MTLIVEDGTGKSDAESYVSVADTDTYLLNLGYTVWAKLNTQENEQALRRATKYMGQAYRLRWIGSRKTSTQALDWPRVDAVDYEGFEYSDSVVPQLVKNACAELSFKAASGELVQDMTQTVVREKVDKIEVEYAKGSVANTKYTGIDLSLRPILVSASYGGLLLERN